MHTHTGILLRICTSGGRTENATKRGYKLLITDSREQPTNQPTTRMLKTTTTRAY